LKCWVAKRNARRSWSSSGSVEQVLVLCGLMLVMSTGAGGAFSALDVIYTGEEGQRE
jgi:hypothetical protein